MKKNKERQMADDGGLERLELVGKHAKNNGRSGSPVAKAFAACLAGYNREGGPRFCPSHS